MRLLIDIAVWRQYDVPGHVGPDAAGNSGVVSGLGGQSQSPAGEEVRIVDRGFALGVSEYLPEHVDIVT